MEQFVYVVYVSKTAVIEIMIIEVGAENCSEYKSNDGILK